MFNDKSYLSRPSIDLCATVFAASIHAEATMAHHAIDDELRETRGIHPDDEPDLSRLPQVSHQKAADALSACAAPGTAASKYSVATHYAWTAAPKGRDGAPSPQKFLTAKRPLSHLRSIAPLSSLILDPEVGAGPAERFFLGLDAYAARLYNDDVSREELLRRGFAAATRVIAESWRSWGAELLVTGRTLPPRLIGTGEDLSPVEIRRMVDVAVGCHWWPENAESWARARRCDGWIVDPADVEAQSPTNSILWVLQHSISFRLLFPAVPLAPQFGLELLGLALSSKADGMPWSSTEITRKPRAALVADLCFNLMLPLSKDLPSVEHVVALVRSLDIVRAAGDPAVVAEVLLDARRAVANWLHSYSIPESSVDDLLHDVFLSKARMSAEDEDPSYKP